MKCVCPMGGDRTCPDDCPLAVWQGLSEPDRKAQRKPVAEKLYQQGFTMEAIATQLGVNQSTITRDLSNLCNVHNLKSAKTVTNPKGAGRRKGSGRKRISRSRKTDPYKDQIIALSDDGKTCPTIGSAVGINKRVINRVLQDEDIRRDALEELLGAVTAQKFSASGALRIEDAIRIHKERLNKAFEQRVNEEVRRRIAEADDAMRKQNKELLHENIGLQQMLNQRGIFSEAQFNNLLKCIHPDNSASIAIRNELLPFLLKNKQRLVTTLH